MQESSNIEIGIVFQVGGNADSDCSGNESLELIIKYRGSSHCIHATWRLNKDRWHPRTIRENSLGGNWNCEYFPRLHGWSYWVGNQSQQINYKKIHTRIEIQQIVISKHKMVYPNFGTKAEKFYQLF